MFGIGNMVYASTATWFTPAKAHPTEAGRKRVRQEIPTYTEEGCKRVRQNMEFPEARQMRFDRGGGTARGGGGGTGGGGEGAEPRSLSAGGGKARHRPIGIANGSC